MTPKLTAARRSRSAVVTFASAALITLGACGGDDPSSATPVETQAGTVDRTAQTSPVVSDSMSEANDTAPAPTDGVDSVTAIADPCTLLEPARLAELLDADPVSASAMPLPSGCLWQYGDGEALALAIVPTEYGGTVAEGCALTSNIYSDVETFDVVGQIAFAGVDQGSTTDTLVMCFADATVVLSGGIARGDLVTVATEMFSS
jgi:hypothetical protein